ncbi:MAG: hypothetical protein NUV77_09230, partial [Thermoguttaceae bacterium]|nr:hypothetical protein [Thermoguttaceae bacterium]
MHRSPLWLWAWLLLSTVVAPSPAAEPQSPSSDAIPAKLLRYAQRLIHAYDADGDGCLGPGEWASMRGDPRQADADKNGVITLDELARHVADYAQRHKLRLVRPTVGAPAEIVSLFTPSDEAKPAEPSKSAPQSTGLPAGAAGPPGESPAPTADDPAKKPATGAEPVLPKPPPETKFHVPAKRLPPGLPDWFRQRDADGDGQLSLSEYAPKATPSQIAEFSRLDVNGDGLLTAKEYVRATGT